MMLSPSDFVVRMARIDQQFEAARLAGDIPRMQELTGESMQLYKAMYGETLA